MEVICINNKVDDLYVTHNLTLGRTYYADDDNINQPDCYWLVNDILNYIPYKKSLFITKQEIRKQKLEKIKNGI